MPLAAPLDPHIWCIMLNARGLTLLSRPRAYDGRVLPLRACVRNGGRATILSSLRARGEWGTSWFLALCTRALYWKQRNRVSWPNADERIAARTLPIKRIQRARLTLTRSGGCVCLDGVLRKLAKTFARCRNYGNYYPLRMRNSFSNL